MPSPEAQMLVEHIKAAIQRASAGHMAEVLAGDDDMRQTLEARNVAAMLWPAVKDNLHLIKDWPAPRQ